MRGSASMADVEPDMNVTPLVDICLVLLIIFMVVAPRMNQDIQVDLPGIFNPDPDVKGSMDPLKITVPKSDEVYINKGGSDEQISLDDLEQYLKQLHETDPHRKLVLRGDENLEYGEARKVMARVQESGYPGISFLVGKIHREGEPTGQVEVTHQRTEAGAEANGGVPGANGGGAPPADTGAAPANPPGQGS